MGNKAKKRAISELNPAEKSGNANFAGQERKKIFKKAKANQNSPQAGNKAKEAPLTKPQVNNGNSPNEWKKLKKQKVLHPKSGFQVSEAESEKKDVKPGEEKVVVASVVMSKKLKKLKANQLKREKRKQGRKEHGQYRVPETMTNEHMRKKIDEIQTRGNLTKTAKRKLRILKKKLAIAEGTAPPPPSPPKINPEGGAKLTKNQKKKLRKEKMKLEKLQNSADVSTDETVKKEAVLGKNVKQEAEVGSKKKLELGNGKAGLKKPNKNLQKPNPKVKVPVESGGEDDESEDENDESAEEAEVPISLFAKKDVPAPTESEDSEVADEDDDDDEEEEIDNGEDEVDDEEDEESDDNEENVAEKKLTDIKGKKEPKNKNTSPQIPTQENGEKKKRYVLFVGNVPFK